MGYSKRQLVLGAYDELGLASYEFDLQPEDLQSALQKLDNMMAEWNGRGIRLFYPIDGPDSSDLDTDTRVPDYAVQAIIKNLAVMIAPSRGKTVSSETKTAAKKSLNTLQGRATRPPQMQQPSTMPAGAGNKRWRDNRRSPFLKPPCLLRDPIS